ncbi:hypothetical protein EON80_09595 [bacterium]|nr:MAG: hypothetical protein EON80_09595 [bacterium]
MKTSHLSLLALPIAISALATQSQAEPKPSMAKPIKLTGIVAGSPNGGEFFLRANGQTFSVKPLAKVGTSGIRGGDRVRVWGRPTGLRVNYANVRVLTSRASDNPTDYNPAAGQTIDGG